MFSLICVWIRDWVTIYEAGGLRHHWAHYEVTVMMYMFCTLFCYDYFMRSCQIWCDPLGNGLFTVTFLELGQSNDCLTIVLERLKLSWRIFLYIYIICAIKCTTSHWVYQNGHETYTIPFCYGVLHITETNIGGPCNISLLCWLSNIRVEISCLTDKMQPTIYCIVVV